MTGHQTPITQSINCPGRRRALKPLAIRVTVEEATPAMHPAVGAWFVLGFAIEALAAGEDRGRCAQLAAKL